MFLLYISLDNLSSDIGNVSCSVIKRSTCRQYVFNISRVSCIDNVLCVLICVNTYVEINMFLTTINRQLVFI